MRKFYFSGLLLAILFATLPASAVVSPGDGGSYYAYCRAYWNQNLPCNAAMYENGAGYLGGSALPNVTTSAYTPGNWGSTNAEIQANFPGEIVANFTANPAINAQVTAMQSTMAAMLSTEMTRLDPGNVHRPALYLAAAQHLSAENIALMRSAFGPAMDPYIEENAPALVLATYHTLPVYSPTYLSIYYYNTIGTAPLVSPSTTAPYDTFLMAYTSASDSVPVALRKTATYLQVRQKFGPMDVLGGAAAILGIISFFDPNAWADFKQWTSNLPAQIPSITPPDWQGGGFGGGAPADTGAQPLTDVNPNGTADPNQVDFEPGDFGGNENFPLCGYVYDMAHC
jgi:hypothetical protein